MKSGTGLLLFVAVFCLLPASAGCGLLGSGSLRAAQEAYDADDFTGAKERLKSFLDSDPTGEDLYRAHRLLAECYLRLPEGRNVPRALKHYEAAAVIQAPAEIRKPALRRGAALLFEQGQYAESAEWYALLALLQEGTPEQAAAYHRAGVSSRRAGKWKASRDYFERLLLRFPQGPLAEVARRALAWKKNGFAVEIARHVDSSEALKFHDRLSDDGVITDVVRSNRGGKAVYVVRLTELFATWEKAVSALLQVQRQGYPDTAIYPQ